MKNFKKILIVVALIVFIIFAVKIIKEKIDANTVFALDNENKYIIDQQGFGTISEGGLANSNYYCEIDLNNRYIDLRYDFEYFEGLDIISDCKRLVGTKKRKLIKRCKITEEEANTIKQFLEKMEIQENNDLLQSLQELQDFPIYYSVKSINNSFAIKDSENIKELEQILKNINEKLLIYI